MAEPAHRRMPLAEFLDWDDGTDTRYELVGGVPVAMAPAVPTHGAIVSRLARILGSGLSQPCQAIVEAGLLDPEEADAFYVADLAVTCETLEKKNRWLNAPVLVVEVLSPSTQNHDRGVKLDAYRQIASVREILFVSSERRRVEYWRRDGERWIVEDLIGGASLTLEVVAEPLRLDDLYDGTGI